MPIAVFAIDPGKTTGLAWGLFERRKTVGQSVSEGRLTGGAQILGTDGLATARGTVEKLTQFRSVLNRAGHNELNVHVVIEDFILRPQKANAGRDMLSPVLITGMIEGMLHQTHRELRAWAVLDPVYQMPSEAKGFATNERIAKWDLPLTGGRHSKDAWRHIAVFIAKKSQQQAAKTASKGK